MADEITVNIRFSVSKGGVADSINTGDLSFDMSGTLIMHTTMAVGGPVGEALVRGEILAASNGWLFAINRDDSENISIATESGADTLVTMEPGEPCLLRLTKGNAVQVIGSESEPLLEYILVED